MSKIKKTIIILIHALIGWAMCGAIIGIGFAVTTEQNALIIHALVVPVVFVVISLIYFKWFNYTTPFQTGLIFFLSAIMLDFFVVALLIEKSFEMFTSILGTWIPFALIFLSTYLTGLYLQRHTGKSAATA
jgi:hypothetical protein